MPRPSKPGADADALYDPGAATALYAEKFSQPAYLIRRAQQIANAVFKEEFSGLDLSPIQYSILLTLRVYPRIDQARIAGLVAIDRTSCWRGVENLVRRGLIVARVSTHDGRKQEIALTTAGEVLLDEAVPRSRRMQQRLLEGMAAPDRARFTVALRTFIDANAQVSGAPASIVNDGAF